MLDADAIRFVKDEMYIAPPTRSKKPSDFNSVTIVTKSIAEFFL